MTINEALILGKPLILLRAKGMRPVQAGNERWAAELGLGILIDGPRDVGAAVEAVMASSRYREAAARHYHTGVFAAASYVRSLLEPRAGGEGEGSPMLAITDARRER